MTSLFLAKKGFEITIVRTFLLERKDFLKVICFDDMIKAKLHLKNSYTGDRSEYNLQSSCKIQEIVKVKGHLQNTLLSCLDHTDCEVCAKGKAGACLSLCSSHCPA